MTELHYNNIFGTASVGSITLTAGGTTATFAAAPAFPTIGGGDFAKIIVEPDTPNEERIYVTAYTSGATTATVTRGQEGSTAVAHTAVAWVHGPTAANVHKIIAGTNVTTSDDGMGNVTVSATGGAAAAVPTVSISTAAQIGGDMTINSVAFVELAAATGGPGTGGFDLSIAAAAGDVLLVGAVIIGPGSTGPYATFDFATMVSGSPVHWVGQTGGAAGLGPLFLPAGNASLASTSGVFPYAVVSGDVSGGTVKLRIYYRTGSAANRLIGRSSPAGAGDGPLTLWAANHGH